MIFPVKQEHKNPPPKYQGETETFIWKILNKAKIKTFSFFFFLSETGPNFRIKQKLFKWFWKHNILIRDTKKLSHLTQSITAGHDFETEQPEKQSGSHRGQIICR